ncbi:hypothetical protein MTR67_024263 [Solanum verrucosum]|uniref:Uncharacterized protein n=1 Tax=Solanum verrucosum TaxID=315347 RepID=A0AAF0TYY1_SOLVR|nr:hypothetical protein MTR67_024263 [Solanum verrucosum]
MSNKRDFKTSFFVLLAPNGTVQVGSKAVNSFLWASFPPQLWEEFHCHEVNTCLHRFKILFPSVFSPFSLSYREMAAWGVDFTSSATVFTSSPRRLKYLLGC